MVTDREGGREGRMESERKRGRKGTEGEREEGREKYQLVAFLECPDRGSNQQPSFVP